MTLFPTVLFTASGGDPGTFLTSARNIGLPIRRFEKKDGTFCGEVSAFRYRDAARLARKSGLRLRAKGRTGLTLFPYTTLFDLGRASCRERVYIQFQCHYNKKVGQLSYKI